MPARARLGWAALLVWGWMFFLSAGYLLGAAGRGERCRCRADRRARSLGELIIPASVWYCWKQIYWIPPETKPVFV